LARVGDEAGTVQAGYRKTTIDREQIKLHRVAWFMTNGVWPEGQIDHIEVVHFLAGSAVDSGLLFC
jgi:hypothetical protein